MEERQDNDLPGSNPENPCPSSMSSLVERIMLGSKVCPCSSRTADWSGNAAILLVKECGVLVKEDHCMLSERTHCPTPIPPHQGTYLYNPDLGCSSLFGVPAPLTTNPCLFTRITLGLDRPCF